MFSPSQEELCALNKEPVKYGELVVLGYNGSLPNGDRGRRKSRFALYKRSKASGVKPSTVHVISTPQASKAISSKGHHSISYTLSRSQTVIVEYIHDKDTDMFQDGPSEDAESNSPSHQSEFLLKPKKPAAVKLCAGRLCLVRSSVLLTADSSKPRDCLPLTQLLTITCRGHNTRCLCSTWHIYCFVLDR